MVQKGPWEETKATHVGRDGKRPHGNTSHTTGKRDGTERERGRLLLAGSGVNDDGARETGLQELVGDKVAEAALALVHVWGEGHGQEDASATDLSVPTPCTPCPAPKHFVLFFFSLLTQPNRDRHGQEWRQCRGKWT